jgi:hypothetical protein
MAERDPEGGPGRDDERDPLLPPDEEAAWAQIVAGYGDEPDAAGQPGDRAAEEDDAVGPPPVRSFTVYAAGTGPRDWRAPEDDDEDHFVPPEPPPLPQADTTTKFGWVAALGGPLLLLAAILFGLDFTWWLVTLGVGGFIGGFLTLMTRLREGGEDDYDDPGGGAVV